MTNSKLTRLLLSSIVTFIKTILSVYQGSDTALKVNLKDKITNDCMTRIENTSEVTPALKSQWQKYCDCTAVMSFTLFPIEKLKEAAQQTGAEKNKLDELLAGAKETCGSIFGMDVQNP